MGGIGVQELLLIFLVILLLFGGKKIPEVAQSLGKGIREFKKAMQDTQDEVNRSITEAPKTDKTTPSGVSTSPDTGNKPAGNP